MRFARALSLILVFCLASTFTLACAFACQDPSVPAVNAHCHQAEAKADPAPIGEPSFAKPSAECPMLAEMDRRPASLSASSVAKVSVQPHVVLPLETAILATAKAPAYVEARPASPSSLPLYLKKRVLRI